MFYVLGILIIIACIVMIFLVMVQNSKGGGLATNLTGGSAIASQMGSRRGADFVEKATWYVLAALLALAFMANIVGENPQQAPEEGTGSRFDQVQQTVGGAQVPALPGGQQQQGQQGQQGGQQQGQQGGGQ